MSMVRLFAVLAGVCVCLAQTPADLFNQPPADVDQALRARMSEFYQDHVDGKYRQAEELVAPDTKDYFYAGNKPHYLSFEIKKIDYSDGYTKAKALVLVEQYVMVPGFEGKPLKVPIPSTWELVDGKWCWYVDEHSRNMSPFGEMKGGPAGGPPTGQIKIPSAEDLHLNALVKTDKAGVRLKAGESETVTVTSTAPGEVTLSLIGALPGVEAKFDRVNLKEGEKAVLTFRAGAAAKPGILSLRVDPTNQIVPITVAIR